MNDFATSLIRTYVGLAVGAALTWLAARLGIVIDETTTLAAAALAVAVVTAAYYTLVRTLESRWPRFGKLLGSAKAPTYVPPVPESVRHVRGY